MSTNISNEPIMPGGNAGAKKSNVGIIVAVVLFIFIGLPIIMAIVIIGYFTKFANEFFADGLTVSTSDVISNDVNLMQSIEVFDTAVKYQRFNQLGLATYKDCENIANNIVGFRREDGTSARWFGNGFCSEPEIAVFSETATIDLSTLPSEIDMDDLTAEALSFSDGRNCATLIISRLGVLEYSFDSLDDAKYCQVDPVKIELHDSSRYQNAKKPNTSPKIDTGDQDEDEGDDDMKSEDSDKKESENNTESTDSKNRKKKEEKSERSYHQDFSNGVNNV